MKLWKIYTENDYRCYIYKLSKTERFLIGTKKKYIIANEKVSVDTKEDMIEHINHFIDNIDTVLGAETEREVLLMAKLDFYEQQIQKQGNGGDAYKEIVDKFVEHDEDSFEKITGIPSTKNIKKLNGGENDD